MNITYALLVFIITSNLFANDKEGPINGGPLCVKSKINEKEVYFWSPGINKETLSIKPRPSKVNEAIMHPEKFFRKDAEEAVKSFDAFSKTVRDCLATKKGIPEKVKCFSSFSYCFNERNSECMTRHDLIPCSSQLTPIECATSKEERFNVLTRCFEPYVSLAFMFTIYNEDAKIREYYSVEAGNEYTPGISCVFTVMNKNEYHLTNVFSYLMTRGRPDYTIIPEKLYERHNALVMKEDEEARERWRKEDEEKERKKNLKK